MICKNYFKAINLFLYFALVFYNPPLKAQNNTDSLVFSIADQPVYKTEFLRQLQNNISSYQEDKELNITEYADLYIDFKLKILDAKAQGLDTLPKFKKEYIKYRKQLADKHISNGDITEKMIKDTYYRMVNEINVSHILLPIENDKKPSDTLQAYNKAIEILKQLQNGASFEKLAITHSKDPSVQQNKGNLGWFKAYKMVYPFENAAYNLEINQISHPVRTKFGYHIIKKNDQRPSKGKLQVAHIMIRHESKDSTSIPQERINKIHKKLLKGEKFEDLAKQFSEHEASSANGGMLVPFSIGSLSSPNFEKIAFALNEDKNLSEPFQTQYGWHIAKYYGNIPVKPFAEIKQEIIKKIKTSTRSQRLKDNIKKDLLSKYTVTTNYEQISTLEERIGDDILKFKWKYNPQVKDKQTWIIKIDNITFNLFEFLKYVEKNQRSLKQNQKSNKINTAIDQYTYAQLIATHNNNLEKKSPDFANQMKSYYEGILLFDYMQKNVWNPIQNDSISIQNYYNQNQQQFYSEIKIDGILATTIHKKQAKKINKDLIKDSIQSLKNKYPKTIFKKITQTNISSPSIPKFLELNINKPKTYKHNNQIICVNISKIYPSEKLKIEDVKGKIINTLQEQKEKALLKKLKKEYKIFVNESLITQLQKEFEN